MKTATVPAILSLLMLTWAASAHASCKKDPKKGTFAPANSDFGIALNVINRDHDDDDDGNSQGFRVFEGVTAYYSFGLDCKALKPIANLTALNFYSDRDIETGVGVGILYEPGRKKDDINFTISLVRGYNLMTDGDEEGWYWLVGFGWNFK